MFVLKNLCYLVILLPKLISGNEEYQNSGLRAVLKIYDECSKIDAGFVPCLKKKAITFIDRIGSIETINFGDGVKVVKIDGITVNEHTISENELESTLPRGLNDQDVTLTNLLFERIAKFFNGHTVQINFPKMSSDDLGRGLEEGRGKMKKMMGMMMMGMAMKLVGLIPIAIAALYVLAGKALIISKIALLLAGIMLLKKLLASKGQGGSSGWSSGGGSGGWSSGGGHGGGWDRRSFEAAQDMAYRSYLTK